MSITLNLFKIGGFIIFSIKEDSTLQEHLIVVDGAETPPTKKLKPLLASSSGENSPNQNPSFSLANNTLLQKSM